MEFIDPSKTQRLGDLMVTNGWLKETLVSFLSLTNENLPPNEFSQRLREEFIIHRVGKGKEPEGSFYWILCTNDGSKPSQNGQIPLSDL